MSETVSIAIGNQIVHTTREEAGLDPLPSQEEVDAVVAGYVRAERDTLLAACDWIVTKSLELGEAVPQDWLDYRQALRDVTSQDGFPNTVVWPTAP